MVTIELAKPWTYRTSQTTIDYPAGSHEVYQYIAAQAAADGAITPEEEKNGSADKPAKGSKKGAADAGEG